MTYDDDELDDLRREARAERRGKRRLAALRAMHPNDPDYDPEEHEALEEWVGGGKGEREEEAQ